MSWIVEYVDHPDEVAAEVAMLTRDPQWAAAHPGQSAADYVAGYPRSWVDAAGNLTGSDHPLTDAGPFPTQQAAAAWIEANRGHLRGQFITHDTATMGAQQDGIDQWQARAEAAGQRMARQGWAMHVTSQVDLPSGDVAWSATLAHHGSVVGLVEQAGGGGAPLIRWGQGQARVQPDGQARPSEVWDRDLAAASTDEETALSGLDQIDVTNASPALAAAESMTVPPGSEVTVALTFTVHDPGLLLDHAQAAVAAHGAGHDLDRADLGDAIAEVLLHSNPTVPGYLDHGIELVAQRTSTNPGGWARTVPSTLTLHAGPARPAYIPPPAAGHRHATRPGIHPGAHPTLTGGP